MNFMLLSEETPVASWITTSFPIIRIVLFVLVVLCAIILIITTLLQHDDSNSAEAITGQQDTYYSKNKGGSRDAKLKLITIICACTAVVCSILYFLTIAIVEFWI